MKKINICQNCEAINRVDLEQSQKNHPVCGKCQQHLNLNQNPSSVSMAKLEKVIAHSELPVIVDIYADWCGPCKMYGPIFERVSKQLGNLGNFFKVDSERFPELSRKYNIRGIPTTLFFKNNILVKSQSGLLNENQLSEIINSL